MKAYFLTAIVIIGSFLAKAQTSLWLKPVTGMSEIIELHLALDHKGNTYVLGNYKGKTKVGDYVFSSEQPSCVIFKVDINGSNIIWATELKSDHPITGHKIAVDKNGNVAIVGDFTKVISAGFVAAVSNNESLDCFTAYLNNSGTVQWIKQIGGEHLDQPEKGVAVNFDPQGNVLSLSNISGNDREGRYNPLVPREILPKGNATYDNEPIRNMSCGLHAVLTKISPDGKLIWMKNKIFAAANDMDMDQLGNIYIVGEYYNYSLIYEVIESSPGLKSGFLLKLNPEGEKEWINKYGAKGSGTPGSFPEEQSFTWLQQINVSSKGQIIAVGTSKSSVFNSENQLIGSEVDVTAEFVVSLTSSGKMLWSSSGEDINITGCEIDQEGNSYIAIWSKGRYFMGERMVRPTVFKISPEKEILWRLTQTGKEEAESDYHMTGFSEIAFSEADHSLIVETTAEFDNNYVLPKSLTNLNPEEIHSFISLQKVK